MKLSIIIPVYNVEQYLEKCLQSVIRQDIPENDYEIIVVNDGSTDQSAEIIERFAKIQSNIKSIEKTNGGVSSARNAGLRVAQGEYLMFIDSDDSIKEYCLKNLLAFAKESGSDLVQFECNIVQNDESGAQTETGFEKKTFANIDEYLQTCYFSKFVWHIEMWRFLFKRSLIIDNYITFNEEITMGEDQLFSIEAISKAEKPARFSEKIYNYLVRTGSAMNTFTYKHAVSQLKTAFEIKKISESKTNKSSIESLFYNRFINIFVIYQYIDRMIGDKSITHPVKTIKQDIQTYSFQKLYYIPQYKSELIRIFIYNCGLTLYCRYKQIVYTRRKRR